MNQKPLSLKLQVRTGGTCAHQEPRRLRAEALPSPSDARLLHLSSLIPCIFLVASVPSPELGLGRGQKLDGESIHSSEGETAAGHCRVEQRPVGPQRGRACRARQLRWVTALSAVDRTDVVLSLSPGLSPTHFLFLFQIKMESFYIYYFDDFLFLLAIVMGSRPCPYIQISLFPDR